MDMNKHEWMNEVIALNLNAYSAWLRVLVMLRNIWQRMKNDDVIGRSFLKVDSK